MYEKFISFESNLSWEKHFVYKPKLEDKEGGGGMRYYMRIINKTSSSIFACINHNGNLLSLSIVRCGGGFFLFFKGN